MTLGRDAPRTAPGQSMGVNRPLKKRHVCLDKLDMSSILHLTMTSRRITKEPTSAPITPTTQPSTNASRTAVANLVEKETQEEVALNLDALTYYPAVVGEAHGTDETHPLLLKDERGHEFGEGRGMARGGGSIRRTRGRGIRRDPDELDPDFVPNGFRKPRRKFRVVVESDEE